jgi:hypothetical protein
MKAVTSSENKRTQFLNFLVRNMKSQGKLYYLPYEECACISVLAWFRLRICKFFLFRYESLGRICRLYECTN